MLIDLNGRSNVFQLETSPDVAIHPNKDVDNN